MTYPDKHEKFMSIHTHEYTIQLMSNYLDFKIINKVTFLLLEEKMYGTMKINT